MESVKVNVSLNRLKALHSSRARALLRDFALIGGQSLASGQVGPLLVGCPGEARSWVTKGPLELNQAPSEFSSGKLGGAEVSSQYEKDDANILK